MEKIYPHFGRRPLFPPKTGGHMFTRRAKTYLWLGTGSIHFENYPFSAVRVDESHTFCSLGKFSTDFHIRFPLTLFYGVHNRTQPHDSTSHSEIRAAYEAAFLPSPVPALRSGKRMRSWAVCALGRLLSAGKQEEQER